MQLSVSVVALVVLALVALTGAVEQTPYNPVANASAIVKFPNARFTVLTAALIRYA